MTDVLSLIPPGALLARPDLAEQGLEGLVRAAAYRTLDVRGAAGAAADILSAPRRDAERVDQLIFGEAFDVLETRDGFAWGRARRDGVVGWIASEALTDPVAAPTHRVQVARAEIFAHASGGAPVLTLSMNALVAETGRRDAMVQLATGGWIAASDLAAFDQFDPDLATAAERLLGSPHLLGGRTFVGTDCAGMVQQALYACGQAGPRYASAQAELGRAVDRAELLRGDLVVWLSDEAGVWGGHAGVMIDGSTLIHAAGDHGAVLTEALSDVAERYAARSFASPAFRRFL